MKAFTVIFATASLLASSYAGVGVVTPEIEAEALRLWQAYCDGTSEGGTDGALAIFCKRSGEKVEEALTHELALEPKGAAQDQVVFVQPPSYHYKHDVVVSGGGGTGPKTVIYVKPSKNTHEVNIQDQTAPAEGPQKPTLYFLKGAHGGAEEPAAAAGARRRRDNAETNSEVSVVREVEAELPKKRTVYIIRRH